MSSLLIATQGLAPPTSIFAIATQGFVTSGYIRRAFLVAVPIPEFFAPVVAMPFCSPAIAAQAESFVQMVAQADQGDIPVVLVDVDDHN